MAMAEFRRDGNAFNYVYDKPIKAGKTVILKVPPVGPNKRGVNDVGWETDSEDVSIYATISDNPERTPLWTLLLAGYRVNKTVSAFKIVNSGGHDANVCIRIILS